ncbi:hypothetical protein ACWC9T_17330 [Kitasatospora sp. NPDC001159]
MVHAVIRGSAVNQDGRPHGPATLPRRPAWLLLYCGALVRAGVDPGAIGLVEAHGASSPLGAPSSPQASRASADRSRLAAISQFGFSGANAPRARRAFSRETAPDSAQPARFLGADGALGGRLLADGAAGFGAQAERLISARSVRNSMSESPTALGHPQENLPE